MRVLYSSSELGLGHVSRTIALGRRLMQRGHELHFFSGSKAFELLKNEFPHVYRATPIAWYENSSGIITSASLVNILLPLPRYDGEKDEFKLKSSNAVETIHRYYDMRQHIKEINPELLIADGDINALRLAQKWKIPDIYITNLIRPSYGFSSVLNPGERLTEHYVKHCQKIVIPDNPPPNTVCEYNIGSLVSVGIAAKTEYVGSFFDVKPAKVSEQHIYAPVSGPYGTRAKLLNMLLPAFKELKATSIISLGIPGERKSVKTDNSQVHNWLSTQERMEAMRNASIVVFSGGHITCFETIKYAKPTVCIPTQPEQLANAAKLRDLGCSIMAKDKKQLVDAIRQIQANYDKFRKKAEALNHASNKSDGLSRAVEIIEASVHH